jgi:DNA-binding response OmpR family regulator
MDPVLVALGDGPTAQRLGLALAERGVRVLAAETLCEAVRTALSAAVSLIVLDAALLRLTPGQHAALMERVAPGVPVAVVVPPDAPLEARVALEVTGFRVLTTPLEADDLVARLVAAGAPRSARGDACVSVPRVYTGGRRPD